MLRLQNLRDDVGGEHVGLEAHLVGIFRNGIGVHYLCFAVRILGVGDMDDLGSRGFADKIRCDLHLYLSVRLYLHSACPEAYIDGLDLADNRSVSNSALDRVENFIVSLYVPDLHHGAFGEGADRRRHADGDAAFGRCFIICLYERGDKSGVLEHGDICPSECCSFVEFFAFIHPALEGISLIGHRDYILQIGCCFYSLFEAVLELGFCAGLRSKGHLAAFRGRKCDAVTFFRLLGFFLGFFRLFRFIRFLFFSGGSAGDSIEHYGVFHPVVPQLKLCSAESTQSLDDIFPVLVLRHGKETGRFGDYL